jgi:hypothetical protein
VCAQKSACCERHRVRSLFHTEHLRLRSRLAEPQQHKREKKTRHMERDPRALRVQQTQPLLNTSDADVRAGAEYMDAKLDWLPERFYIREAAQKVYPYAAKVLKGMDWLGGKFANGLGLTSSRFQYALDEHNRRERKIQQREEEARARERAIKHQQGLVDEDDSRMPYVPPVQLMFLQSGSGGGAAAASAAPSASASSEKERLEEQRRLINEALRVTTATSSPVTASAAASRPVAAAAVAAASAAAAAGPGGSAAGGRVNIAAAGLANSATARRALSASNQAQAAQATSAAASADAKPTAAAGDDDDDEKKMQSL